MIVERIPDSTVITATEEDQPAGFAIISNWCDDLYLYRLSVKPKYRRRGIATRIIRDAIDMVDSLTEPRKLYLEPQPFDDEPMSVDDLVAWYERLGFKHAGLYLDQNLMVYEWRGDDE